MTGATMAKPRRGKLLTQSPEGNCTERLTFSSMTWELLEEKHGIQESQRMVLFSSVAPVEPSPILIGNMERGRHSRLVNERAKAYRLVDPVLAEIEALRRGRIASIPEPTIEVEGMEGLCGVPDFIISGTTTSKVLPIVVRRR